MAVKLAILDDDGDVFYEVPEDVTESFLTATTTLELGTVAGVIRRKLLEADAKIAEAHARNEDDGEAGVCGD